MVKDRIKIAPFVRVTSTKGFLFNNDKITNFSYKYSEEEDDVCEVTIESDDPKLADKEGIQEGDSLTVTWGFLDSGESTSRKIFIFDTSCEYNESGIKLNLIGHEKFAIAKLDVARSKNQSREDTNITNILLTNTVLDNLKITDNNQESIYRMLDASAKGKNTQLNPRNRISVNNTQNSYVKSNNTIDSNRQVVSLPENNQNDPYAPRLNRESEGLYITLYNGSTATYRTLKDFFDKQPGGPYVIDSRDDQVTIRTRDFNLDPIREYLYKGEDGQLLSFTPETKNRSQSKTSKRIDAISWDSSTKQAKVQRTEKKPINNNNKIETFWGHTPIPLSPEWWSERNAVPKNGARVVGKELSDIGAKVHPKSTAEDSDQGSDRYKRYDLPDGRSVYAETTTSGESNSISYGQGYGGGEQRTPDHSDKTLSGTRVDYASEFGIRDGTATTLPMYIREQLMETPNGPMKKVVRPSEGFDNTQAFAENKRANSELDSNPATAKMVGNPYLECGKVINVSNVADKHAGKYYIKEVTHTIGDGGYITEITKMVKNPNKGKKSNSSLEVIKPTDISKPNTRNEPGVFDKIYDDVRKMKTYTPDGFRKPNTDKVKTIPVINKF